MYSEVAAQTCRFADVSALCLHLTMLLLLLLQVAISLAAYALVGLVGFIDSLGY
jgi:hypothetical protein